MNGGKVLEPARHQAIEQQLRRAIHSLDAR
jgi:hypothetical protein